MIAKLDIAEAFGGGVALIIVITVVTFCAFLFIASVLLPFFVWGIYNRIVSIDKNVKHLTKNAVKLTMLLEQSSLGDKSSSASANLQTDQKKQKGITKETGRPRASMVACPYCGYKAVKIEFCADVGVSCPSCFEPVEFDKNGNLTKSKRKKIDTPESPKEQAEQLECTHCGHRGDKHLFESDNGLRCPECGGT